jgi:hypothetical protein
MHPTCWRTVEGSPLDDGGQQLPHPDQLERNEQDVVEPSLVSPMALSHPPPRLGHSQALAPPHPWWPYAESPAAQNAAVVEVEVEGGHGVRANHIRDGCCS